MKDRILQLMAITHLNQQGFANFLGISPATLNGIFKDRSKPTLNIVDAIKAKFPDLSLEWLLYGTGDMYPKKQSQAAAVSSQVTSSDSSSSATSPQDIADNSSLQIQQEEAIARFSDNGVRNTINNGDKMIVKNIDKKRATITEIRVFYDDQTWESFVPKK